ncbi:MAG: hypothetical protein CMG62_06810 [Candidatus Marinimicrobia bacterium]|nr:hypothetical protein [Candidatus Neomarinimicrobiota bacterium]
MNINRIIAHIKLLRPINVFTATLAMILSAGIIDKYNDLNTLSIIIIVVICFTGGANSLNDIIDYKADLINRPTRPIPSGYVKIDSAKYISAFLFIVGSVFCLRLPQLSVFIGLFISMPILLFYTNYFKGIPIFGNIVVAFIIGLSFIFCGSAFGSIDKMVIPSLLAFGLTFLRELVKDIADIKGDKALGLKTYPIISGKRKSIRLTIGIAIVIGFLSFIPFYINYYNFWYGIFLILGVEIPLGVLVVFMVNNPTINNIKYCARLLKFSTIVGLIAIYFGEIL